MVFCLDFSSQGRADIADKSRTIQDCPTAEVNFYSAYGLRLASDLPIPGLIDASPGLPELQIWLKERPAWLGRCDRLPRTRWYVSPETEQGNAPSLIVTLLASGQYFQLEYADGTTFVVDRSATRLWASWPDSLTLEDTAVYLLGPVFGFVLRQRGNICLHACAVAVGDSAIALVGPPGAGKSTTAAAFARQGYPVLADDVTALLDHGESFQVLPAYPRVCLWPSSVEALCGSPKALPPLTPNWEKRYLPLDRNGCRFRKEPLLLGAIYWLDERTTEAGAPHVAEIPPSDGLMALVQNTYMNYLPDRERHACELQFLGRLLRQVPLRRVTPHADVSRLPKLCEVILSDFQALCKKERAITHAIPD